MPRLRKKTKESGQAQRHSTDIRYTVQQILRIPDLCLKADNMPTVPNIPGPYRVFFYSFDCQEPPHVHVQRERMVCKFWLTPVALSVNHGFFPRELNLFAR